MKVFDAQEAIKYKLKSAETTTQENNLIWTKTWELSNVDCVSIMFIRVLEIKPKCKKFLQNIGNC